MGINSPILKMGLLLIIIQDQGLVVEQIYIFPINVILINHVMQIFVLVSKMLIILIMMQIHGKSFQEELLIISECCSTKCFR